MSSMSGRINRRTWIKNILKKIPRIDLCRKDLVIDTKADCDFRYKRL